MAWVQSLPVLVAVLVVVAVPGGSVLAALGLRGLPLVALSAPASAGVLGAGAVLVGLLGLRWSLPLAAAVTVVAAVAAAALGRWLGGPSALRHALPAGARWPALVGSGAAAVLGALPVVSGIGRPDRPPQTYDAVFHLNALRYVEDTGRASSLLLGGMTDHGSEGGFYPAGWHVLGATALELLGADPVVVANTTSVLLAALVVPAGTAFVAAVLLPAWRWAAGVGAVVGTLFTSLPTLMLAYGTLWPNAWATGALPGLLAALWLCLRRPDPVSWLAFSTAAVGAVLCHPSAAFGLLLLGIPLGSAVLARRWRRLRASGRGRRAALELVGVPVLGVVLLVGVLGSPLLTAVRQRARPPASTPAEALGEALLDSPLSGRDYGVVEPSWLLGLLVLAGAFRAVSRPALRPWAWAWLLAVAAFVISAGADVDNPVREYVTGYWYNDPVRLAGQVVVVAAPLAVVGIAGLARLLRDALDRAGVPPGGPLGRVVHAAGVPLLLIAVLAVTGGYADKQESRVAFDYWTPVEDPLRQLVTPAEEELLRGIGQWVDPGDVVLADPFSGGALAYALGEREVVYPHMAGTWSAPARVLQRSMPDLERPSVCRALEELRVGWFYVDDQPYFEGGVGQRRYRALDEVPEAGVELVARADSAALYRITACD